MTTIVSVKKIPYLYLEPNESESEELGILTQARNQDFMCGGANEAKADPTTEVYFLSSDPFI